MKRSLKGFTLIELLVVIAIIAILAAILFPVFTAAKLTAKKAACVSNMRQICSAWTMYTDDSQGHCPSLCNKTPGSWASWEQELLPYIHNAAVFGCPATTIVPASPIELQWQFGGWLSYGWNGTLFNYEDTFLVKQSDVYKPSGTVFMADTVGANWISLAQRIGLGTSSSDYKYQNNAVCWSAGGYSVGVQGNQKTMPPNCAHLSDRHGGFINVCFCDGHVGSLTEQALTMVKTNPPSRVAYLDHLGPDNYYVAAWTKKGAYFPYFQVSASQLHF